MGFPGTISLEKETFQAVCRDYCRSLARHGFQKLCLLPTHGGNFEPLVELLPRIDEAQEGYHPESEEAIQRIIRDGLKSVTPNGILGDARRHVRGDRLEVHRRPGRRGGPELRGLADLSLQPETPPYRGLAKPPGGWYVPGGTSRNRPARGAQQDLHQDRAAQQSSSLTLLFRWARGGPVASRCGRVRAADK